MKKLFLYFVSLLFLLGCKKEREGDFTETITSGTKFGIQIGNKAANVYAQIQQLNAKNTIYTIVAIRPPYTSPEAVKNILPLYESITFQSSIAKDTVGVLLVNDRIAGVYSKRSTLAKWPQNVPDADVLKRDVPVADIYNKLVEIYKVPANQNYGISLNYKPVNKPYDPDMAGVKEWKFGFRLKSKGNYDTYCDITLSFENGILKSLTNQQKVVDNRIIID